MCFYNYLCVPLNLLSTFRSKPDFAVFFWIFLHIIFFSRNKHRTIILLVVLYGCETWSLTLREDRRLRVFENRMFRRIFGPKRDELTGEWRKLHNEKLYDLYSSSNHFRVIKSRRIRWAEHVARVGERRGVYRILVGKPEGKRQLGRRSQRWEDNIKMDLQEFGCGGMD